MSDNITEPTENRTPTSPSSEREAEAATAVVEQNAPERAGSDKELEVYRSLLETPKEFRNGFTWTAVAGALFCGLLMMPGTIYLSLMTGGTINAAWVTLIIFSEISRRALKTLNAQELVILLYVAGAMSVGGPAAQLIFRQYLVTSPAIRDAGWFGLFPAWYAPLPGNEALGERLLIHPAWLIPILLVIFMHVIGRIKSYTLGYFLFRLTSDVEKLPFPFAPISASGAMALAESGEKETGDKKGSWKWRVFSIGAVLGLSFAVIQIGIPLVTGAVLTKPIYVIPLPWLDTTTLTQGFLPATATGIVIDLALILAGMVMPFWAVIGNGVGVILTLVMNPLLHHWGILTRWQPGMDTISTTFSNSIDFWMSFTYGVMIGVAIISVYQTTRDMIRITRENKAVKNANRSDVAKREGIWDVPVQGRGDFSPYVALGLYLACSMLVVMLSQYLVPQFPIFYLLFFTLIYTPFISYLNARLIGICGQHVEIPMIRETAIILSGYKGLNIWLAPIPVENYGNQAQSFRVKELTGTNFWSMVKAELLIVPLSFVLSFAFWAFVWKSSAIPSESFPWADKMWDLQAKQIVLLWSATMSDAGVKPLFFQALHPWVMGTGFGFTVLSFAALSGFGLPIMAIFGFIQSVGHMPHSFVPILIGAFIGKFYFQKRYGQKDFLRMAPIITAGYGTGVGLIALIGVAIRLIVNAISAAQF